MQPICVRPGRDKCERGTCCLRALVVPSPLTTNATFSDLVVPAIFFLAALFLALPIHLFFSLLNLLLINSILLQALLPPARAAGTKLCSTDNHITL